MDSTTTMRCGGRDSGSGSTRRRAVAGAGWVNLMGDIASGLGQVGSTVGQATGISNLAGGISDLFSGGSQTPAPGAAGTPEFVGPPSPVETPGFLKGFAQGFVGMQPGKGADVPMGAGGEIGGGIGQLFHLIDQLKSGGLEGTVGAPMVN